MAVDFVMVMIPSGDHHLTIPETGPSTHTAWSPPFTWPQQRSMNPVLHVSRPVYSQATQSDKCPHLPPVFVRKPDTASGTRMLEETSPSLPSNGLTPPTSLWKHVGYFLWGLATFLTWSFGRFVSLLCSLTLFLQANLWFLFCKENWLQADLSVAFVSNTLFLTCRHSTCF